MPKASATERLAEDESCSLLALYKYKALFFTSLLPYFETFSSVGYQEKGKLNCRALCTIQLVLYFHMRMHLRRTMHSVAAPLLFLSLSLSIHATKPVLLNDPTNRKNHDVHKGLATVSSFSLLRFHLYLSLF